MSTQEYFLPKSEPPPEEADINSFASDLANLTAIILNSDFARTVFDHFSRIFELQINTLMAMYSHDDMTLNPEWDDMPHGQFRILLEEVEQNTKRFGSELAVATFERDKRMQEDEEFMLLYISIEKGFDNLVKTQGVKPSIPKGLHKKAEILRKIKSSL